MRAGGSSALRLTAAGLAALAAAGGSWLDDPLRAQATRPGGLIRHDRGQSVSPVYEGWYPLPDGAIAASFGYFNRNWVEEVRVPVGPDNRIQPGAADQGQPTHFLPRRHIGVFVITIPAGTEGDVTWTLTSRGETLEIPVNLDPEYLIEPFRAAAGPSPGNTPPVLRFEPEGAGVQGPAGMVSERTATVGSPLVLDIRVTDDGLGSGRGEPELAVAWRPFRGPGTVTFGEESPVVADGRASTTATFAAPGDYVLLVVATDGSRQSNQCCWTNGYVRVRVAAAE
ncbi:MAG: hypothetical protein OXF93_03130 [Acidobacteria bacterium]|nr:hypothetical protein [Acidobacteriota bacterium]